MRQVKTMLFSRRQFLHASAGASLLALCSCGFRLRGNFTLPFETLYIEGDSNSPLVARLIRQIRSSAGVTLVPTPEKAQAVLKILSQDRSREVLSYNSSGDAREYALGLRVRFSITTPDGAEYLEPATVSITRDVTYSDDKYLSRDTEEAAIFNSMINDAISQMMHRIERAKPVGPAKS